MITIDGKKLVTSWFNVLDDLARIDPVPQEELKRALKVYRERLAEMPYFVQGGTPTRIDFLTNKDSEVNPFG
jgi:hypothetical protein